MSEKYLDDSGLAYFWTKIKAWCAAAFAPLVHSHAWSSITGKPDSFPPSGHSHGNVTNGGELGTASRAVVTDASKKITVSSVTSTELGYLSGVTSSVQTQLDGKASASDIPSIPSLSLTVSGSGNAVTDLSVSGHAIAATKGSTFLTSHQDLSNYVTLNTNQIVSAEKTFSETMFFTKGSTLVDGTSTIQLQGKMGNNDGWQIRSGATANDAGFLEIATYDNGNEPIYFRQRTSSAITRTLTLLDASGNSSFPGTVTASSFVGDLTGNAATVSGTVGTSTLAWNSEVTLYTVGGNAIKAKLPANPNTDTLMTQAVSTANNRYPLLLCPTATATTDQGAKTGIFAKNVWVNPSTNELIINANNTFRSVVGNYGAFWRIDTSNFYLMLTASGDQYGSWTSARPITVNLSTGVCNINGNAATATKATQDGSGNTITSTYVAKAGDTMTGVLTVQNSNIKVKDTGITRASSTTAKYPFPFQIVDNANNTLGGVYFTYGTDKSTRTHLMCYKGTTTSSSDWSYIGIGYNGSGNVYTYAPNPAANSNDTNIATTKWANDKFLPLTGGTLTGNLVAPGIICTSLFAKKHPSVTKGTALSSGTAYWTLNFADKNGIDYAANTLAQLESRLGTDNKVYFYMRALKNTANTSTNAEMGVVYDTNNSTGWAYAPEMRISGHAKVDGYIINNRANPAFEGVVAGFAKGSAPSSTINAGFYVHDQNTTFTEATRLGAFAVHVYNDKSTSVNLGAYKNVSGSADSFILTVKCNVDGTGYVAHPDPTNTAENSTLSATTHWVRVATGNFACNAASATKLATARAFRTHLDSTNTANFDGTASCGPGVTGTLPIGNGGTGATTRLNAVKALMNENVGTGATYFLTITDSWAKAGYTSVANAKTVLGLGSAAYTNSSAYAAASHTHSYLPLSGGGMTGNIVYNTTNTVGIRKGNATSLLEVSGGSALNKGARLALYGESHASYAGRFDLIAANASASRSLVGTATGNITWNGAVIQTSSDARLKTALSDVPDAVLDAWEDVRWGQFKMLDAVEEKGEENARFHVGLIAQQAKASFEARGLDGCAYGILCYENDAFDDLWMVRYAEALCMEASYQRRENARLKKRVADLEERLAVLELKIS